MAATCTWDANLSNLAPFPGYESIALELEWDPVSNCGSFTFDHYKVCWNRDTATAPDDPTDADRCTSLGGPISLDTADFFVHWSATQHGLRIYACDNPEGVDACADHYGEGADEQVTDDTGTATTEEEVWVLEDINDYAGSARVVADSGASAAGAFYYSTGTHDDKLGLWWSTNVGGRETIRYNRPTNTGWHEFNTLTDWLHPMTSDANVAEEPDTGGTGKFQNCTHPWVVPIYIGTNPHVRLQVHCGEGTDTDVYGIDSVDEAGNNFGLECLGGCTADTVTCPTGDLCDWDDDNSSGGAATLDVCSEDENPACFYLHNAGHGRYLWGSMFGNYLDLGSDTVSMVITGTPRDKGVDCNGASDDLYTATWTPGTPGSWSVPFDTSPNNCPTITTTDRHDPAVVALPGGEYKVYVHRLLEEFEVMYFDGTAWSAPRDLVLAFDDGASGYTVPSGGTTSLHKCLENLDTFVWHDGQTGYEGAFAKANLENLNDASDCFDSSGILFLEHRN